MHPGDIVAGKYRVTRVLARSRGMLLEARHTDFDQRVVIRLMSPALCDEKELERFRREARTLSKLESEHCARIIDVGTHSDGSFYLVRQYLDGVDLATHLRNHGALRLDEAVMYLLQASEVVQECHSHNIVLRELQPSHLFLAQKRGGQPSLKVLDFGTAKLLKDQQPGGGDPENQATAIFGISNYWSPEMVRKAAIDARTDVWSLGCVFYEMLAAVPAFTGEMAELMLKITRDDPMPITRLRPDLPRELDQIMAWALAKDPNSRFTSVYALAHALRPWASAEGQVLIDQIGRIAHSAPVQSQEAAVSPTSPLAQGAAVLDDDEESGATVIMQSSSSDDHDMEKTSFMANSPFAAMAQAKTGRASIPGAPPGSDPGAMNVNGVTPMATTGPAGATGGFPAASASGQHQKAKQRSTAMIAGIAALVLVPAIGAGLYFVVRGSPQQAAAQTTEKKKKKPRQPANPGDPVPADDSDSDSDDSVTASAETTSAANTPPPSHFNGGSAPSAHTSATASASKSAEPPASATPVKTSTPTVSSGGGTVKLVAIASGGSCDFQIDGSPAGSGSTATREVTPGSHTVTCTAPGQPARTQRKNVEAGKPAMVLFRLGS